MLGAIWSGTRLTGKALFTTGFAARSAVGAGIGGVAGAIQGDYANPNARIESVIKGAVLGGMVGGVLGANTSIGRFNAASNIRQAYQSVGKHTIDRQLARFPEFKKEWARATTPWRQTPTSQIFASMFSGMGKSSGPGFFTRNMAAGRTRAMRELGNVVGYHQVQRQIKNAPAFRREFEKRAAELSPVGRSMGMAAGMVSGVIKHPFAAIGAVGAGIGIHSLATRPSSPTLRGDIQRAQKGLNANTRINYDAQMMAAESMRQSSVAPMGTLGTVPQMMGPMQKSFQDSTGGIVQGLHRGRHG